MMNRRQESGAGSLALGMAMGAMVTGLAFYAGDWQFRRKVNHLADEAVCTARGAMRRMGM